MSLSNRKSERGAGLVEYLLLVKLVFLASIGLVMLFGDNVQALFVAQSNCLAGDEACEPATRVASAKHGFDEDAVRQALAGLYRPLRRADIKPGPGGFDSHPYRGYKAIKTGASGNNGRHLVALAGVDQQPGLSQTVFGPGSGSDFSAWRTNRDVDRAAILEEQSGFWRTNRDVARAAILEELSGFSNEQLEWMSQGLVFPAETPDPALARYLAVEEQHRRKLFPAALTREQQIRWNINLRKELQQEEGLWVPLDDPRAEYQLNRVAFTVGEKFHADYYVEVQLPEGFERREGGPHDAGLFRTKTAVDQAEEADDGSAVTAGKLLAVDLPRDRYGWPLGSLQQHPLTVRVKRVNAYLPWDTTVAEYQVRLQPGDNQLGQKGGVSELTIELGPTLNTSIDSPMSPITMTDVERDLEEEPIPRLPEWAAGFKYYGDELYIKTCTFNIDCSSHVLECLPSGRCALKTEIVTEYSQGKSQVGHASDETIDLAQTELDRRAWVEQHLADKSLRVFKDAYVSRKAALTAMQDWIWTMEVHRARAMIEGDERPFDTDYEEDPTREKNLAAALVAAWPDEEAYKRLMMSMSQSQLGAVRGQVRQMEGPTAEQVADNMARWSYIRSKAELRASIGTL